jgi:Domain of unknown function (DUF4388)
MQFRGHVRDLPLRSLLEVLYEQRQSCDVTLSAASGALEAEGVLVVRGGRLLHAQLGPVLGLAALEQASAADELVYDVGAPTRLAPLTVHEPHEQLIAVARLAEQSTRVRTVAPARDERLGRSEQMVRERAERSRVSGRLALGAAVFLVALVMALRPTSHAAEGPVRPLPVAPAR